MIKQEKKQGFIEKALLSWLPTVGTALMVISYFPAIHLTFTTQNVEGQSLSFWVLLTIALGSMIGQQLGMIKYRGAKSYTGLVFQVLNFSLALVMLIGIVIFS